MKSIEVHIELNGMTSLGGTLYSYVRRGREGSTFHYDADYRAQMTAYPFEPAMPLTTGEFAFTQGLPRSFRDSSPDRWGRMLIEKGLKQHWTKTATPARTITEVDYLLGTSDLTRQGALRFRQSGGLRFEAANASVPKLLSLPLLLAAANKLCSSSQSKKEDVYAAIKTLLDAGTGSLGGARPKSSVIEQRANESTVLHLAKFPHPADRWDVMKWEKLALDLAAAAGILVPESKLLQVDRSSVLLLKRFDREETGSRIGYMSAMTLLESEEGHTRDYVDIADALAQISASASQDLAELWLRILFSVCVNNTDDHLRNHAVLRLGSAWRLSPAFDLNPDPDLNSRRATAIGGATSFDAGWTMLQETRELFGVSESESNAMMTAVSDAISKWKTIALKHGIKKDEIELFLPVFRRAQAALASATKLANNK